MILIFFSPLFSKGEENTKKPYLFSVCLFGYRLTLSGYRHYAPILSRFARLRGKKSLFALNRARTNPQNIIGWTPAHQAC